MPPWKTHGDLVQPRVPFDDEGQLTLSEDLLRVFHSTFPQQQQHDEIVFAFGYGSGVFAQTEAKQHHDDMSESKPSSETEEKKKMLDMIIIVEDAWRFHSSNIQANPHHYAPLFRDAARATWWQRHELPDNRLVANPKIFFNFVQDPWLKYGVMERRDLLSDLENWDSLYIAGRMHKPTATIFQRDNTGIGEGQVRHNLPAALATALLLSCTDKNSNDASAATSIPLSALYSQISALSYTGDFRMQVGAEDPAKIDKLVHSPGQLSRFHQLYYGPAIQPLMDGGIVSLETTDTWKHAAITWNPQDSAAISHLRRCLPPRLRQQLMMMSDTNAETAKLMIQRELHSIVAPAARYQSFKGLWTAGLTKSASYALAKLSKGLLRRR
jgi:mitochondrial translocator assembly and maintenance protein 41